MPDKQRSIDLSDPRYYLGIAHRTQDIEQPAQHVLDVLRASSAE